MDKKNFLKSGLVLILLIVLCYVANVTSIPDGIILFEGENLQYLKLYGVTVETSTTTSSSTGKYNLAISLFNKIPLRDISVNIIPKTSVVPVGNSIGIKLYTSGVLVVGMSEIYGDNNQVYKPYENSGIEEGDMIVEVNNDVVTCTSELIDVVNKYKGEDLELKYSREGNIYTTNISPAKVDDKYKLGLWVRDGTAGVGTISFYEPSTGMFAALGHGIVDVDTEKLLSISTGEILSTNIISIQRGEKGKPGELKGAILNSQSIGKIYKNTDFGIYGKLENTGVLNINKGDVVEVATRDEIKKGKAELICTLENNLREKYEVEVETIYKNNNSNNKSMIIKVTDERLIDKTGGIIQGMSGSPIVQNGKLIGAVTHVLVNDPTMGYAVFADLMVKKIREVE